VGANWIRWVRRKWILATARFDDGTYGSLLNETPTHNTLGRDQPAARAEKYSRSHTTIERPSNTDLNQHISFDLASGLSHCSTVYLRGAVHFPTNTVNVANADALRKLTY
jgi:hypothetical protein